MRVIIIFIQFSRILCFIPFRIEGLWLYPFIVLKPDAIIHFTVKFQPPRKHGCCAADDGSHKRIHPRIVVILIQKIENRKAYLIPSIIEYSSQKLLVALDFLKPATVREGVKWLPEKQLDVFFVTLNKADKDYSPTTMYKDYSINESLFHWQSQSTTAENSATGQRYIHHREKGSRVLLFVREFKADARFGGAGAYTYLGTVNYVKHEGSRPMNITWRLNRPIPAKFLKKTNKLVVG